MGFDFENLMCHHVCREIKGSPLRRRRVRGCRNPGHRGLFLRELVHSELRGDCRLVETCIFDLITL